MALSDRNQQQGVDPASGVDRWGRGLFIAGSLVFIAVGLTHTATQFTTLSGETVRTAYRAGGPIALNTGDIDGWDLFAGVSVLMGLYAIALGVANLVALRAADRADGLPPAGTCAVNLAMLVAIGLVGIAYLGPLQIVGGLVGLVLFGVPLVRVLRAGVDRRAGTAPA